MVAQPTDRDGVTGKRDAVAEAALSAVPPLALPPLMAPSAGVFAAAAAMGFGFANQMAGAYLGFLKGAMDSTRMMAEALGAPEALVEIPVQATEIAQRIPAAGATILPLKRDAKVPLAKPVTVEKAVSRKAPVARKPVEKATVRASEQLVPEDRKLSAKPAGKTVTRAKAKKADPGDLKQIAGIGPKLEQMLKARGISTLADIAGLAPADALALDAEIGLDGRIERDGWVKAAAALV